VGDGHPDPEGRQGLEGLVVEGGDRLAGERDRRRPAGRGVDGQLVVDEVEVDGDDRVAVGLAHGSGGGAVAGEVEGVSTDEPGRVVTSSTFSGARFVGWRRRSR
jgi:hypothetical protein